MIETCGKKLFVENANDFMSVYADGEYVNTGFYGGDDIILDRANSHLLRVEKWGNSNFDDPRMRSLRLTGKRGINSECLKGKCSVSKPKLDTFLDYICKVKC